jgi:hypothetical protein
MIDTNTKNTSGLHHMSMPIPPISTKNRNAAASACTCKMAAAYSGNSSCTASPAPPFNAKCDMVWLGTQVLRTAGNVHRAGRY